MRLSDFKNANCPLLRTPPVDYGKISGVLDDLLMETWKSGGNANSVIDKISKKSDVIASLANEMAESIAFQRYHELEALKIDEKSAKESLKSEYEQSLKSTEEESKKLVDERAVIAEQSEKIKEIKASEYSASERALNEMRNRITAKVNEIGGEKNLVALLEINRALVEGTQDKKDEEVKNSKSSYKKSPEIKRSLEIAGYQEPKNKDDLRKQDYKTYSQKKWEETFVGRVWRILNYKIW